MSTSLQAVSLERHALRTWRGPGGQGFFLGVLTKSPPPRPHVAPSAGGPQRHWDEKPTTHTVPALVCLTQNHKQPIGELRLPFCAIAA
jgi:hypothetical protein